MIIESRDEDIAICEDEINKSIEKIHKVSFLNVMCLIILTVTCSNDVLSFTVIVVII